MYFKSLFIKPNKFYINIYITVKSRLFQVSCSPPRPTISLSREALCMFILYLFSSLSPTFVPYVLILFLTSSEQLREMGLYIPNQICFLECGGHRPPNPRQGLCPLRPHPGSAPVHPLPALQSFRPHFVPYLSILLS